MELTGKCREEFEKWYLQWVFNEKTFLSLRFNSEQILQNCNSLHPSEKYGVYVDFFDSVGINSSSFSHYEFYKCNLDNTLFHTRSEARLLAIEKANKIYNNAH